MKRITFQGETKSLTDWADQMGFAHLDTLSYRISKWGVAKALTTPVKRNDCHKMSKSPEYKIFGAMIDRCTNPNHPQTKNYLGRNIKVHPDLQTFIGFINHIGFRPDQKLILGRLDVNKDYEPGNVAWVTRQQAQNNRTCTRRVKVNGVVMPLATFARKSNVSYQLLTDRLRDGKTIEQAITLPKRAHKSHPKKRAA